MQWDKTGKDPKISGKYVIKAYYEGENEDGMQVIPESYWYEVADIIIDEDGRIHMRSQYDSEWDMVMYWMKLEEPENV